MLNNCQNCLEKCKAACCGMIPFDRKFVKANKPPRKWIQEIDLGDQVILETEDLHCPYLNEQNYCSIYEKRPEVCRLYGNESQINLICPYQDKEGRIRGRQERRKIERDMTKMFDSFMKRNKRLDK